MTSELSNDNGKKKPRHPWDWYVEQQWVTHALVDMISLDDDVTYLDPFCGMGNIPMALRQRGLQAYGTDKFTRTNHPLFLGEHDFLGDQHHMMEAEKALSIIMNPAFSFQDGVLVQGLSLRICRRALEMATHKVAALVPLKWLSSETRYQFFMKTRPQILVFSERPSMPPGNEIEALGDKAWKRGKVDYMWLVWDKQNPHAYDHSPTLWIPPREKLKKPKVAA
ncbi:MAG: hypothetical protein E2598_06275 [Sphingobium sp.]|nr:hypothetical protein [Sphingobium sp.]